MHYTYYIYYIFVVYTCIIYVLYQLFICREKNNGLTIFKNCGGSQMERIKKHLKKVLKDNDLDVIIDCNRKTVNYFDVTFNPNGGT